MPDGVGQFGQGCLVFVFSVPAVSQCVTVQLTLLMNTYLSYCILCKPPLKSLTVLESGRIKNKNDKIPLLERHHNLCNLKFNQNQTHAPKIDATNGS